MFKRKRCNYTIEFKNEENTITIPLKYNQQPILKVRTLADMQITGLKKAEYLLTIKGEYTVNMWKEDSHQMAVCQKYDARVLQRGSYTLYKSDEYLYLVRIDEVHQNG